MTLPDGTKLGLYDRRFTCSTVWLRHRRAARGHALDRAPDRLAALRSRGANLLPPAGRETMRAAHSRTIDAKKEKISLVHQRRGRSRIGKDSE